MNGKGDKRRKITVSQETWDKNWELIFGKKEKKCPKKEKNEYK